jgi:hypothetical protein
MYNTAYTTFHYLFSKAVALTTVVMAATTVVMAVTTVVMAVTTAEVKCHNYVSVVNDVSHYANRKGCIFVDNYINYYKMNFGPRGTITVVQFEYSTERNLRN